MLEVASGVGGRVCMVVMMRGGRAALAVDPAGVAVRVMLLLPDRHAMFHFVDDVTAGREGLAAVRRADAHPDGEVADAERADTMHAGGLGVPVLQYLAAAGVGRIGILDGDHVEASNLHRQPLYGIADIGRAKAEAAAERLGTLNRDAQVDAIALHATRENIDELVAGYDLVVECTDNFRAKFLVNDAVVRAGKPAVFASVHQYEGQLQVYLAKPDWPCLRCLWPAAPRDGLVGNCTEAGVLGPVPATLGAMQAMQALQLILGLHAGSSPALVMVDLLTLETRRVSARRDPACCHDPGASAGAPDVAPIELEFVTLTAAVESGLELIDIREAWERGFDPPNASIPLHLPLSDLVNGRVQFPAQGRYLVICAHGVRSLSLTEHLRSLGQSEVYSLRGGLAALRS